ncbi:protein POLR1D-like [Trichomycterus rosablanca]|uniref:protein POLR1D-like n=1 Tax=Trichomycterus rosablanca TaxID=2290929 RepID=UPI002F3526BA
MAGNDDNELERRAVEELLKEANRGRVRAETMGPAGWMKCPLGSTNKRFLLNTLRPCVERRSRVQGGTSGREDEGRRGGDRSSRHRSEDRESSRRKDDDHRRERSHSYSQSKSHRSSRSGLAPRDHSPHPLNRSSRTRSRSPVQKRSGDKQHRDRTKK